MGKWMRLVATSATGDEQKDYHCCQAGHDQQPQGGGLHLHVALPLCAHL